MEKKTTEIVVFSSAFHDLSSQDCKQSNSMQTSALLNLDKKNFNIFLCAQQLPIKIFGHKDVPILMRSHGAV